MAVEQLITEHMETWTGAVLDKKAAGRGGGSKRELYGVKKLREHIFELAAKGYVCEQSSPKECSFLRISEFSELVMGQAPPGAECNKDGHGDVFVKTGEFGVRFPEVREWTTKPLKFAKAGDVLICVVGATVGKLNLAIDCAIGRSVAAIRPNEQVVTEYLYYSLHPFVAKIRKNAKGSAQGVIGKVVLNAVKIRVPPLAEQHRIVAKVDELMALCDQLEQQQENSLNAHQTLVETLLNALTTATEREGFDTAWARIADHFHTLFTTPNSIQQLRQTLLQLAVMGKLVAQKITDGTANSLLETLTKERDVLHDSGNLKKSKEIAALSEEEHPFTAPLTWEWTRLANLLAIVTDGDHQAPPKSESGVPFLVISNVNSGQVRFENCRFVPRSYYENLDWTRKPNQQDLLYTVTGSYGIAVAINDNAEFCVQRHIAILKALKSSPVEYIKLVLESTLAFEYSGNPPK